MIKSARIELLPAQDLIKTGPIDHADWNYKKMLGYIQRLRFKLCLSLMNDGHFDSLLEVGYGSGIFFKELDKYATTIYGLDIHNFNTEVRQVLKNFDINVELYSASVIDMPFDDNSIDAVVSISCLEFSEDIDKAYHDVRRILKPSGSLFMVTPGFSEVLDLGFSVLTGKSAKDDFKRGREFVIPLMKKYFKIKKLRTFPSIAPSWLRLYSAYELTPIK